MSDTTANETKENGIQEKISGCLYGGAVGDAMGSPTEGLTPEKIRERFGVVTTFQAPASDGWKEPGNLRPLEKGNAHISDDTLMTECLLEVYLEKRRHLDAFDVGDGLVSQIADIPRYLPELRRDSVLLTRLFYPEQYLFLRHRLSNVDPREGGQGNMVNCGAAMYMSPVGIMNAGDPDRAYREAIDLTGAHQWSYGREAAGVMAAAVAEALSPDASVESIVNAVLSLAKEGTRQAIAAVVDAARGESDWRDSRAALRAAVAPFDTVTDFGSRKTRNNGTSNRPSRQHSIEELPIAVGLIVVTRGNTMESIYGGVNYGNDSDSIAAMAGAITGALNGMGSIPAPLRREVDTANHRSFADLATSARTVAQELFHVDAGRFERRKQTLGG